MRKDVVALWHQIFEDEPDFIERFLDFWRQDCIHLAIEDGKVAAMASLLPCNLVLGGAVFPARYLYAVATHPDLRGRGIAKQLVSFARGQEKEAAAVITVPAEESLHGYYASQGFVPFSNVGRVEILSSELFGTAGDVISTDAAGLKEGQRLAADAGSALMTWSDEALSFQVDAAARSGGGAFLLSGANGRAWVLAERRGAGAKIAVIAADRLVPLQIAAIVSKAIDVQSYSVSFPAGRGAFGQPHAMIYPLKALPAGFAAETAYCALAMD